MMKTWVAVAVVAAALTNGKTDLASIDVITKPFTSAQLEVGLRRAVEHRRLVEENRRLREQLRQDREPAPGDLADPE